ncbi:MAG: hypothetical protein V1825_04640 [Candidatus Falkowbacteria bacterium]
MNKKTILIIGGIIIIIGIIGGVLFFLQKPAEPDIPYYFIAIHNEPYHDEFKDAEKIEASYLILKQMIEKADEYNIKLTLMFTAQWADYIAESPERMANLESWKKQGHEIAAHHHSIYHGNWDGYTNYSSEEAIAQRIKQGKKPETYLGTLEDYINKLKKINPDIKSGCVNDEHDKKVMPDEIIYDTCSGFANFGEPGQLLRDGDSPEKGYNEYMTVGEYKSIRRTWLAHYQITTNEYQKSAQIVCDSMDSGVYGAVTHSIQNQAESYYKFLEFLHSKDLAGEKSRTISEIIESKLLPEKLISEKLINKKTQTPYSSKKQGMCGDFICDEIEKANSNLCREDCENNIPYYFIAIHNEPRVEDLEENYQTLKTLVLKANNYGMKLTLMFTSPWVDFLLEDPIRKEELEKWKQKGHEIAAHHHGYGVYVWDGYSYESEADALASREEACKDKPCRENISYNGDMEDYMIKLKQLNLEIKSGCLNEEREKDSLPNAIIYPTCSGFANFGTPGTYSIDLNQEKGRNDFITLETINKIERKWLSHTALLKEGTVQGAKDVFWTMNSQQVYGTASHSVSLPLDKQAEYILEFMDFLHEQDPTGEKSRTVTEIIESNLLPEKEIEIYVK